MTLSEGLALEMEPAQYEAVTTRRGSLVCSVCGYGIVRDTPPGPCPMCRTDDAWVQPTRRPN